MFVMRKSENRTCASCRERPLAFAKVHFKRLPPRQGLFRGKHFRNYVASLAAGSPWNTIGSGLRMGAIQWEWWRFCTPEGCCVWKALGPSPRIQGPWGVDAFFRISYTIGVTLSAVVGACQWRTLFLHFGRWKLLSGELVMFDCAHWGPLRNSLAKFLKSLKMRFSCHHLQV